MLRTSTSEIFDILYSGIAQVSTINDTKARELAIICLANILNLSEDQVKEEILSEINN